MFYSPWDTDCIRTVDLLETVAKTFIDNDVYFAAVNCWEPKGWYKISLIYYIYIFTWKDFDTI